MTITSKAPSPARAGITTPGEAYVAVQICLSLS